MVIRNLLFLILVILVGILLPTKDSYAWYPGSYIDKPSCLPFLDIADPVNKDPDHNKNPEKNCRMTTDSNGDIAPTTPDNFMVLVSYKIPAALCLGICSRDEKWIKIGDSKWIEGTKFEVRLEAGDQACVYARPLGITEWTVPRGFLYHQGKQESKNSQPSTNPRDGDKLPEHCVYIPEPPARLAPPRWGKLISPVCYDYDSGASKMGNTAFTSVVVQCVEDSLLNIFFHKTVNGETFFGEVQKALYGIVRALLALYIIFIGYRLILEKKVPRREEWGGFVIKLAVVIFITFGAAVPWLLPKVLDISKGLSSMAMSAGVGTNAEAAAARGRLDYAMNNVDSYRNIYIQARIDLLANPSDPTLQMKEAQALISLNAAREEVEKAKAVVSSFGYNYCNFREKDYRYLNPATNKIEDKSWISLFDMVDCKMQKFLGMGINSFNGHSDTPQVLFLAAIALWMPGIGILIFIFTMVYVLFVVLILIKAVHTYIVAVIAIVILGFVGPLIAPALLFDKYKQIFDTWTKYILGYMIQPFLLFAFITMMFSAMDPIMWGGNKAFDKKNNIVLDSEGNCQDPDALGCMWQTMPVSRTPNIFGDDARLYFPGYSIVTASKLLWEILKLCAICMLVNALFDTIKSIMATITDTKSATDMTAPVSLSPQQIGSMAGKAAMTAYKAPFKYGKKVGKAVIDVRDRYNRNMDKYRREHVNRDGGNRR